MDIEHVPGLAPDPSASHTCPADASRGHWSRIVSENHRNLCTTRTQVGGHCSTHVTPVNRHLVTFLTPVPLETRCLPKSAQLRPPARPLRCSPPNHSPALIARALRPSTRPATSTQFQIHSVLYLIGSLAIPLIILLSLLSSSGAARSLPGCHKRGNIKVQPVHPSI